MTDVFTTPKTGAEQGGDDDVNLGLAIALPVCLIVAVLLALLFFACVKYRYLFWIAVPQHKDVIKRTDRSGKGPLSTEKSHFWIENALPAKEPGTDALSVSASILSSSFISEGPGEWYRAIHHYEADEEGRLSLEIGQLVEVKEKLDTGWWLGFSNTDVGWFPATYVEPLSGHYNPGLQENSPKDTTVNNASVSNVQRTPDIQKTYKAVCIYKPNGSDELAVQPGDSLVHVNRDPNGWVKVKNKASDLVGWVPMATLEEATAGDPSTPQTPVFKDGSESHITGIECVSVYKYEARDDGDLSFDAGEPIVAFQILDNGWWRGYHNMQEGWFPGSYVQIVPQSPATIDSGYTSPRTPTSRVRINLEKSFDAAAVNEVGHPSNGRPSDKVNGSRNPFFLRFNSWKDQMNPGKMFHPRVVRIRASQLKKRIGNQFRRNNVPPPPAPPKNTSPTVVMISEPPMMNSELPSGSEEVGRKETTLTLEGFESGETLDTGETEDSTDGEFDDDNIDDSSVTVSTGSQGGLTTFDKIVIEKRANPEEEKKKKESLERAQKLLAELQKAAPRKYSGDIRESLTNQYLKNKERKLSQDNEFGSASNFIRKISLDDDNVFDLNMVESSVDVDSDSKSDSSGSVIRVDTAVSSANDEIELSRSTDDVTKSLISDKVPSSDSRNSSWGSKKDVPVVAVRPVGHEITTPDETDGSGIKIDIDGISNGVSSTDEDIKKGRDSYVYDSKEKTIEAESTDTIFGEKWDYRKLFAGLDDFNPSFEIETNIDDVMEEETDNIYEGSDQSKNRKSKDLRLLIPPPAEFVDWEEPVVVNEKQPENNSSEPPNSSKTENGSSYGISFDRSVSVNSENSPITPTSGPVAPSRRRKKGPRPPAPPPPPPIGDSSAFTNSSPVIRSPPMSSSTPNSEKSPPPPKPTCPPPPKPSTPLTPPPVIPAPPARGIRSPTKAPVSDKPVEMRKNGNSGRNVPVNRKSVEVAPSNRKSLNGSDQNIAKPNTNRKSVDAPPIPNLNGTNNGVPKPISPGIQAGSSATLPARPVISAPIPTPELEDKPQVSRAIPLSGQSSKNQTLPADYRTETGLPKHLRLPERSSTLPHGSVSIPVSPSKNQEKSSPKRQAPLPPTSAPVSPTKPPSPSKSNMKVTFSEDMMVPKNRTSLGSSPVKRPPRPPPPKAPSPSPPTSPTSPKSRGAPKSILVRSKTDSNVGSHTDDRNGTESKNMRKVWKSHSSMMEGELSLPQDSLLRELEAAPGKPGFIIGMTQDGQVGTFPRSYLKVMNAGSDGLSNMVF